MTTFIERTPATRLTHIKASLVYLVFMTVWVYGFAMPRQETFALLAFPPFLALIGPGVSSLLWVPLVMMMVFPGAPLVLLGLWLRNHLDPKEVEDYLF